MAERIRGLLTPSATRTTCPFKGEASYWHLDVAGRRLEDVAWSYPDPLPGCPPLAGLVSFYQEKLSAWLVEDDEQVGHPRDPFHRVDARRSSRRVVVRVAGEVVAETRRPVAVFETGLPVRYYIPAADVRREVLQPSDTVTVCPTKGWPATRTWWSAGSGTAMRRGATTSRSWTQPVWADTGDVSSHAGG